METLQALGRDLLCAAPRSVRRRGDAYPNWDADAVAACKRWELLNALTWAAAAALITAVAHLLWRQTGLSLGQLAWMTRRALASSRPGAVKPVVGIAPWWLRASYLWELLVGVDPRQVDPRSYGALEQPRSGGLLTGLAETVVHQMPNATAFAHSLLRASLVTAGCFVFRWGVSVLAERPRGWWEVKQALERAVKPDKPRPERAAAKSGSRR